jgi:hypothetical protein
MYTCVCSGGKFVRRTNTHTHIKLERESILDGARHKEYYVFGIFDVWPKAS